MCVFVGFSSVMEVRGGGGLTLSLSGVVDTWSLTLADMIMTLF